MKIRSILFVGNYPNPADLYRNVFFQNLIFAIADKGIRCSVIAPVSYTHYRSKIRDIPKYVQHTTGQGNTVDVYYPRCVTYSSKKILGIYNTGRLSEHSFQRAAVRTAKKRIGEFDCVYGHFFLEGGLAAAVTGREFGKPSFIAFGECDFDSQVRHDYGDLVSKELEGLCGIVSVSTDNSNELKTMPVFDPFPVLLAPNGVDSTLFHPMDQKVCRKELNIPDDCFIAGFVGGFIERKGVSRVLEAVRRTEGVYGAFAGKGDRPDGPKVVFCKALPHEQIPIFLNACDVFVLPTLSEGSCNAIIEALACGLPVVSSDLPFNDDILTEHNSIRIDPMDVQEISSAVRKLYEDGALRAELSRGALETAKNLMIEERAKRILAFMEKCSLGSER